MCLCLCVCVCVCVRVCMGERGFGSCHCCIHTCICPSSSLLCLFPVSPPFLPLLLPSPQAPSTDTRQLDRDKSFGLLSAGLYEHISCLSNHCSVSSTETGDLFIDVYMRLYIESFILSTLIPHLYIYIYMYVVVSYRGALI